MKDNPSRRLTKKLEKKYRGYVVAIPKNKPQSVDFFDHTSRGILLQIMRKGKRPTDYNIFWYPSYESF